MIQRFTWIDLFVIRRLMIRGLRRGIGSPRVVNCSGRFIESGRNEFRALIAWSMQHWA
jgi:hypothetical protein